ncbi:hypothetical protein Nepgr_024653 [Nepenthes gracilis]|uniref:MIP18 family-like domain-containing protein n=1 Tax=Nepenthes gracilis TaxID=150966 RepID=A0AAD3T4K3_NEPGR|nr:hypothetical protein Nepgr_024653 [Nepenthes gracilis]
MTIQHLLELPFFVSNLALIERMIYELLDEWLNRPSTNPDVSMFLMEVVDPDFTDIVPCGFVKDMPIDEAPGEVIFHLELTTLACPIMDMFEQRTNEVVSMLPWVNSVKVTMSAQPVRPALAGALPCMGIGVGILDADAYGPSLPPIVSPEHRLLEMNLEKMTILHTEYFGIKWVTFGLSGQGRAVLRGPMVSGVINQLLTTAEWRELDYLVIDMLPRTGDIQLTLCQIIPLIVAVIVTTPQKLAFIDVAKGVHMFSKLKVPCVAVVQNMCHFEADGKPLLIFARVFPFFNLEDKILAMERVMLQVRWIQFIKYPQFN